MPPPTDRRSTIIRAVATLLTEWGAGDVEELERQIEAALDAEDEAGLERLWHRVETTGRSWGYNPRDPVARELSRFVHRRMDVDGSLLTDDGGLAVARERPVVFLGNHLSFIDANSVDYLLARDGWADIADQLTVLTGPKVFDQPLRRLGSLAFGTIKMPQSPSRASGAAVLPRRETLRLARATLDTARERRRAGDHLLIFSEGTRSRSGAMERVLPAVARYLAEPPATVVPFGLWGTEKVVPLDDERAHPHPVCVRFGRAIDAAELFERAGRNRAAIADAIGFLTAELLPAAYRGCYGGDDGELAVARALASAPTAGGGIRLDDAGELEASKHEP